jgi:ribosomal protein S3
MDPTIQTESAAPEEVTVNGDAATTEAPDAATLEAATIEGATIEAAPAAAAPTIPAGPAKSYDDLFPSLPMAAPGQANNAPVGGGQWNRKPMLASLASSTVTQVFRVPIEERKGGGSFGATDESFRVLKNAMVKSGAKIEMSSNKDQSLTFLITGKQDAVLKARKELLTNFQQQAQQVISIPKEHHKYVLGKGGHKLQDLEALTATKISMPKAAEQSDKITISGTKEGIEKAIHEIRITSDEQSKQAYETMDVPKMYHPFINGPNGDNQRRIIGDLANVRINIPPLSVMKNEISVAGEKEAVLAVVDKIKRQHEDMHRKFSEVSVEVKKSQHKYIIGPRGNSINEILEETGVFVEMPHQETNSETITLRGPQEKLGLALTKVYEKANSVVSLDVTCPNWLHKYIIGKKGASIQKLTSELTKVHVEFMDGADKIKVEGPPEEVEKAREQLAAQAAELVGRMSFAELSVDAKYHKHIIGKGGSTVNKIKQETDVMINIPDSEKGETVIRIEGSKDGVKKAMKELESLVSKMENEREKDLIIESRFHRLLIGPKGENIQKLREDFAAVQISFPELGSKSEIVKLRGPRDDVDKCAKILTKSIKELTESNYQVQIPIFKQFHKFVIGKAGATIGKIRQETDTRIGLPQSRVDSDMITVTGKKENVEKAVKLIQQIQTEMANVVSVEIQVPANIHNTMIGSGGKLIQSVMDDCGGVSIKFPPPDSKSDKVTIRGPKDDVEKAKKMLMEMASEKALSSTSVDVRAKPEHHKFLIGRNGSNVQAIRDKTGARIIFPSEKDKERDVITIVGTKEAVAEAKKELEAKILGLDNVVEETMTVDPKYHRHFVSRRGEVLRQISDEFGGVIVSFPRASGAVSDKVTLKGAKNCLEGAQARIAEIVHDLECQVTIECVIDQHHHRTVMGARGSKVQKICAEYEVNIKIPERARQQQQQHQNGDNNGENNGEEEAATPAASDGSENIIRISGKAENCEAAAEALRELVPVNIEVEVAFEFHRYIIGAKGAGVRQLMEAYDVNIRVPSSDQESNTIVITGAKDCVEGAKIALGERVKELEGEREDRAARSFEIRIEVSPEHHPKIIGRRGAVIQQLRKDHGVNVQLPKKGEGEDERTITITGYEENALKAKEEILAIVREFEAMTQEEVKIDARTHSMIIGRRGVGIRKVMQDYKVDIKMPREGDADPDLVVIFGAEDAVLDCKDHLLNLCEEFLQDVQDREWMNDYVRSPDGDAGEKKGAGQGGKGFKVGTGAPWQGASDESFPTLGNRGGPGAAAPAPATATGGISMTPAWGPRR